MRHTYMAIGLAIATLAFTNCTKETINNETPDTQAAGTPLEIYADIDTRTVNNGPVTSWANADEVALWHNGVADTAPFIYSAAEEKFSGLTSASLNENNVWRAVYPYTGSAKVACSSKNLTQAAAGSSAHLAGKNLPLYGTASTNAGESTLSVTLNNVASLIRVNISNDTGNSDLKLQTIEVTSTQYLAGNLQMDASNGTFSLVEDDNRTKTVTLTVTDGTLSAGNNYFYIPVRPMTLSVDDVLAFTMTFSDGRIAVKQNKMPEETKFASNGVVKFNFGGIADDFVQTDSDNRILIPNAATWNAIGVAMNAGSTVYPNTAYYMLKNDVDFAGMPFVTWKVFKGTFGGNFKTIKNVTAAYTGDDTEAGFGIISKTTDGSEIRNLYVQNINISSTQKWVGGLVGYNAGVINKVSVQGNVTCTCATGGNVGGICGTVNGKDCETTPVIMNSVFIGGTISNSVKNNTGCLSGALADSGMCVNSYVVTGTLSVGSESSDHGGLVGYIGSQGLIENCYSKSITITGVTKTKNHSGGVGYFKKGNVRNIYTCTSSTTNNPNAAWGQAKNTNTNAPRYGASSETGLILSQDDMKNSTSITIPFATGATTTTGDFVTILNEGIKVFNAEGNMVENKRALTLKTWVIGEDGFPAL